jgi:hypothetical protein
MINKQGVQLGVISFGMGCAREGVPGVYGRTAVRGDASDWLLETLCDMTQTNDLDEWCGKADVSMALQQETAPSAELTAEPTTEEPTEAPSREEPTEAPTVEEPTEAPTAEEPSLSPSVAPATDEPTPLPSEITTAEPTPAESQEDTVTGKQSDTDNTEVLDNLDEDLCIDEPDTTFFVLGGENDCRWLRCAHEAIRQSACLEGTDAWKICRFTCGRCPDS